MRVMLKHYSDIIPQLEADFKEIYNNMRKITNDEKALINMKIIRFKNETLRQHKEKREKKGFNRNQQTTKNEQQPTTTAAAMQTFPWEQRPQRAPCRGRGRGRGRNTMQM